MKENENSSNNDINNESVGSNDYSSENELDLNFISDNDKDKFKSIDKIEKIVCPKCGKIPSLEIDPKSYTVKSQCPDNHILKQKLVDFIYQSNLKIPKTIKCSSCKKTNEELKNEEKDIYKCICEEIICEECKEKHEAIDDSKINHELIKYSEFEFQCHCSGEFSDYLYFCINCNENLCSTCQIEHVEKNKDHSIICYSDEIDKNLTDNKIKEKKDNFQIQKDNINDFIENLDEWKKKFDSKIENLKNNLELFLKVNEYILDSFDKLSMNQQTIDNIKNLNFSYDQLINEFNKNNNDNNFENKYGYLIGLLNYQKNEKIKISKKYNKIKRINLKDLNILKNNNTLEAKIEGTITSICQIENGFAIGDKNGQIHCYKIDNNTSKLTKTITISQSSGQEINYLCSLKNKYFISSNIKEIKIIKLKETKEKTQFNIIGNFKYDKYDDKRKTIYNKNRNNEINLSNSNQEEEINTKTLGPKDLKNVYNIMNSNKEIHYQILELSNDNIIYIDENKLKRLEPTLNDNYIKKNKPIITVENIICMTEINENKFCIYSEDNNITIFDSDSFAQKEKKIRIRKNQNDAITKIEAINNNIIAGMGSKKIYIISIISGKTISIIENDKSNLDMKIIVNHNKILISTFVKSKGYLSQYNFNITKDNIVSNRNDIIESDKRINKIFLLQNEGEDYAKLICVHDNSIKIYSNNNN